MLQIYEPILFSVTLNYFDSTEIKQSCIPNHHYLDKHRREEGH